MKDDLIRRQAAIDAVESTKTARTPDGEIYVAKINAEMNIQILPSAQQWILCSERLPKESDGKVLITVSGKVEIGKYSEFSKRWYIGDMNGVGGDDPIAWMPLLKPYKEGQDEQT